MTLLRRSRADAEGDGGGGGPPPSDSVQSAAASAEVGEAAAAAFESDDGDENDEDPLHSALASLRKQQTVIEVTACKTRTPSPVAAEGEGETAAAEAAAGMGFDSVVPQLGIHLKWMGIHLYHTFFMEYYIAMNNFYRTTPMNFSAGGRDSSLELGGGPAALEEEEEEESAAECVPAPLPNLKGRIIVLESKQMI